MIPDYRIEIKPLPGIGEVQDRHFGCTFCTGLITIAEGEAANIGHLPKHCADRERCLAIFRKEIRQCRT